MAAAHRGVEFFDDGRELTPAELLVARVIQAADARHPELAAATARLLAEAKCDAVLEHPPRFH